MATFLRAVRSAAPYHLLSYGALVGAQFYQSFINTKLCYRYLPMPEFIGLQKRVFPAYFKTQVGLVLLTAITHPPASIISLSRDIFGLVPLAVILLVDALNWFVYGPKLIYVLNERIAQEIKDGRSYGTIDGMSPEMMSLNRQFSRHHAMSIHLNAVSLVATVIYGFRLASRMRF